MEEQPSGRGPRSSSSSCSLHSHEDDDIESKHESTVKRDAKEPAEVPYEDLFGSESEEEPAASRVEAATTPDVAEGVAPKRVRILPSTLEPPNEGFPEDEAVSAEFELGGPMELKFPVERVRHPTDDVAFFAPGEFLDVDLQFFDAEVSSDFVENGIVSKRVIRWRKNAEGDIESNTRLVEWDDGSFSFYVEGKWYDLAKERFAQGTELLCIDQQKCLQALHAVGSGFYPVAVPTDESDDESEAQIVLADAVHAQRGPKTKRVTVLGNPVKEQEAKLKKIQQERRDRELMERRQRSLQEKYTLPRTDHLGDEDEEARPILPKRSRPSRRQPARAKKHRIWDSEDEIMEEEEEEEEEEIGSAEFGEEEEEEEEELLSSQEEGSEEEKAEKPEPKQEEDAKNSDGDAPEPDTTQESSERHETREEPRGPRIILLTDEEDDDISDA